MKKNNPNKQNHQENQKNQKNLEIQPTLINPPQPPLTERDHLTARYHRGLLTDREDQKYLARKNKGDDAEDELVAILERELPENWALLRNIWLKFNGNTTETDILIMTPKFWRLIEVKNYTGEFEYRGQMCYLNQKHFPDQIAACRNRKRILKEVGSRVPGYLPEIRCTMVFMNERCQVSAEAMDDIDVVMRHQLSWYIEKMLNEYDQLSHSHIIPIEDSLATISRHQITNPYPPKSLNKSELNHSTPGIRCPQCHSYQTNIAHRQVVCSTCHHTTSKTEAVLRAACELGTLYFNDPTILTAANLYQFTGHRISHRSLQLILKKTSQSTVITDLPIIKTTDYLMTK